MTRFRSSLPRPNAKKNALRSAIAATVSVVAATAMVACSPASEEPTDRSVVIAVDNLPAAFDPSQDLVALDASFLLQAVLTPLLDWAPTGEAIPALATGYELSEDRMSVEFTLREGATFVDGTPVDAASVERYLDHTLQSDNYVFKAVAENVGAEFTATGDYTLELKMTTPVFHPDYQYWDAIRLIALTPVLSPAAIDDPERAKNEPMSAGAYRIEEFVPDVEVTLIRNDEYWDLEEYPYETVVLKVIADPIARLNALKSGQVDVASLPLEQAGEAESSGLRVEAGNLIYNTLVVRNPEDSTLEPLRDARVRQAMMLAFDRETIAETLDKGYGTPSSQAFVEGRPEYIEGGDERYGYDPERARELLAEAGYPDGIDVVIPADAASATVRPIVESSLAEIGIRVTFEEMTDAYVHAILGGEYPLLLWQMADLNTLRLLDEEFVGLGRVFDQNDEIDELIEVIKFGDPEESAAASQELGEKLLEEVWYIPFSRRPMMFWASTPDIDVRTNDVFFMLLRDVRPAE